MKRFFSLIFVFLLICAVISCGGKKKKEEIPGFEEQVSKEISAEEGGTVESSDGKTSIEIPAGALDSDTTITMTVYDASGYASSDSEKVISKVVEFEPSGTIFKKPVLITMTGSEDIDGKIITAAVFHEDEGKWSYSESGAAVKVSQSASGDPIMTTASGDPIMLNASGDPIMTSASGDPIMMSASGDPIMATASGDPIMNSAAGDSMMMTTGHFTLYTFLAVNPKEPAEPDEEPVDDTDDTEPDEDTDTSDDEITDIDDTDDTEPDEDTDDDTSDDEITDIDDTDDAEPDEDIVQEPEFSKVPCTGLRTCFGHDGMLAECPAQNEELYGQDAGYIFRKSCLPKSFERIAKADDDVTPYQQIKDNNTGLTWIFTGESGIYEDVAPYCGDTLATYAGGGWRLPTPAELLTIADHDIYHESLAIKESAFSEITIYCEGCDSFWADGGKFYLDTEYGAIALNKKEVVRGLLCVKGDEYGKVAASDYVTVPENGEEMIRDKKNNLYWQKTSVGGKTWTEALKYCENLTYAGHSDWRLPNKNELASLVDFTKENPASSFDGMPAEEFVSSTFTLLVGEIMVDMKTGETGLLSFQEQPQVKSIKRGVDSGKTYSVRCVRSDITDYPENGIPDCGSDGYAPCKASGVVWSARQYFSSSQESVPWQDIVRVCREMPGGKWRIPYIDEIRTVFTDDSYKTDGTCGVTNEHSDPEYNDAACVSYNQAFETTLGDTGVIVSGTILNPSASRGDWSIWMIDTNVSGGLGEMQETYGPAIVARCVLDNSLDDPETFPYTDTENGLVWSSLSERSLSGWKAAAEYCGTLVEGGSDNWRVPTMEELEKIRRNYSEGGHNAPRVDGYYSIFADIPQLWSSTVVEEETTVVKTLDLIDAATLDVEINYDPAFKTRCVRSVADPAENPNHFDEESDFPHLMSSDAILWSKKSEMLYTLSAAEAYCAGLNEEGYGYDYADGVYWTVPSVWYYLLLLGDEESDCSSICSEYIVLSEGATQDCVCNKYTFKSYSVFNDFGQFWTSDVNEETGVVPYLFSFTTGEAIGGQEYYNEAYVRCVADLRE